MNQTFEWEFPNNVVEEFSKFHRRSSDVRASEAVEGDPFIQGILHAAQGSIILTLTEHQYLY